MNRIGLLLVLLLAALPCCAARKMTVDELKQLLLSSHQANKSDHDVAKDLEGVELTEELTHSTMNSLSPNVPGQMTTEQLFILEAQSAALAPPPADIPTAPPPDAATQKAILDKAADYATKTYAQLPAVSASRESRRFQDNADIPTVAAGSKNNAVMPATLTPIRYTSGDTTQVTFRNGAEQTPAPNKGQWGANGMIALLGQPPVLSTVLEEAQQAGKIDWLRWELVNGRQLAVFSYAVDKKKTHYAVNYCCFPESSQAGDIALRGQQSAGGPGNYLISRNWKEWKATLGYHGEIFVDPNTGVVMRLITRADLKGGFPVRVETQRIDYGEQKVDGKAFTVPVRDIIDTVEQPFPDDEQGRMIMRHTLFSVEYKNYQIAGS